MTTEQMYEDCADELRDFFWDTLVVELDRVGEKYPGTSPGLSVLFNFTRFLLHEGWTPETVREVMVDAINSVKDEEEERRLQ